MLRFRPVSILLLLCVLVSFSACASSDSESGQKQAAPNTTPTPTPAAQPLLVWHPYSGAAAEALEQIRLEFEVSHPGIDVQLQFVEESRLLGDYDTTVNAGTGPDLLLGPAAWLNVLADRGLIRPIPQHLFDQMTDRMSEPVARATFMEGIPYGTPFSAAFPTLYYNKQQVTPPSTYDGLLAQAAVHGWVIPPTFRATAAYYLSSGAQLMDETGASLIAAPALESYLVALQALASTPGVHFADDQLEFIQGKAGLLLASSADYAALKTALGDQVGVVKFPRQQAQPWIDLITLQIATFNVNSTAQAVDAAGLFLVFLISPAPQRLWFEKTQQAPVNPSELADPALRDAWIEVLQWGIAAPLPAPFDAVMQPALDTAVRAVTLEGLDLASAAANVLQSSTAESQ